MKPFTLERPQSPQAAAADDTAPIRGLRVLLVEDNAVSQRLAKRLLEKRGHQVTVAGNGQSASTGNGGSALAAERRGDVIKILLET